MKKIFIFFLILVLVGSLHHVNVSAADQKFSWYCTRNSNNKQPLADTSLRFVEDLGGYYIDHSHSDDNTDKVLYLTFDAGYENGNIEKILNILKEENVPGAFFVLKNLIVKNPELVKRMSNEGHLVCNHTSTHNDITKYESKEDLQVDLEELESLYEKATGKTMKKYFRPPEGNFDKKSLTFLNELGYKTVFWSFAYADWDNNAQMSSVAAKKKILDNIHNGAVVLLHPTSATNANILKDVIIQLKAQEYRFGTLDELTQN